MAQGKRVLFLAHRRELINPERRASSTTFGIDAGIILAGVDAPPRAARCRWRAIQTLWSRACACSEDRPAARRPDRGRRGAPRPRQHLSAASSTLPRRGRARPDRHAVPGRRARARQRLRDADRVPVGPGADRAGLPGADQGLRAVDARPEGYPRRARRLRRERSSPSASTRRSSSATSSPTGIGWRSGRKTVVFATGVQHSVHLRDEFAAIGRLGRAHRRQYADRRATRNPK